MSGEFVISSVLSRRKKNLKRRTSVTAFEQTSVTALRCTSVNSSQWTSVTPFYSSVLFRMQRKIHPRGMRACQPKREERPLPNFGSSFYLFFLLPLDLPCVNWSAVCFTWGPHSGPQTFLSSIFTDFSFFSFSHHHSGLLFPILTT